MYIVYTIYTCFRWWVALFNFLCSTSTIKTWNTQNRQKLAKITPKLSSVRYTLCAVIFFISLHFLSSSKSWNRAFLLFFPIFAVFLVYSANFFIDNFYLLSSMSLNIHTVCITQTFCYIILKLVAGGVFVSVCARFFPFNSVMFCSISSSSSSWLFSSSFFRFYPEATPT